MPQVSLATKQMSVVPIGNVLPLTGPDICVKVTAPPGQVEATVGFWKTTSAPVPPCGALVAMLFGQISDNFWVAGGKGEEHGTWVYCNSGCAGRVVVVVGGE